MRINLRETARSVTVLIGFFVVAIGGQILGGPVEATRLRRILGYAALLTAGFLLTFTTPRRWQPQRMLNLTMNGLAAASAFKSLQEEQAVAENRTNLIRAAQEAAQKKHADLLTMKEGEVVAPNAPNGPPAGREAELIRHLARFFRFTTTR